MKQTTSFAERLANIEKRARKGENTGFVTPGVVDDTTSTRAAHATSAISHRRGGYLASALGGLMTSFCIVGVGFVILSSGNDGSSLEQTFAVLMASTQ